MCLSSPKVPAPPPPPPLPEENDEIRERQAAERRRLRNLRGRSSTILTSGLGDVSSRKSASKVLLGN